jgi:hypothetical protein
MSRLRVYEVEVLGIKVTGKFRLVKNRYESKLSLEVAESCYKQALSILQVNGNFDKGFYIEVSSSFSVQGDYRNLTLYRYVEDKSGESMQYMLSIRIIAEGAILSVSSCVYGLLTSLDTEFEIKLPLFSQ